MDLVITYPLLDPGSTCSLVTSDNAGRLGLDGPSESLKLFGIQATSHIETKRVALVLLVYSLHDILLKMRWLLKD